MPFREVIGHRRLVTLLSRAIAQETLPQALPPDLRAGGAATECAGRRNRGQAAAGW